MNKRKMLLVVLVIMGLALGFSSIASALPFQNGSFEDGNSSTFVPLSSYDFMTLSTGGSPDTSGYIPGWTVVSGSIDWIKFYWAASNGDYSIDLDGNGTGAIAQTFDTTQNTWYQVQFDMAENPDEAPDIKALEVNVWQPLAANVVLYSQDYTFDSSSSTHQKMGWVTNSFVFFSPTDNQTTLKFSSLTQGAWGAALDNVRVNETTAPVPEPATIFLLGTGLIGLAGLRKRGFLKKVQ